MKRFTLWILAFSAALFAFANAEGWIKPYEENPRYWQYKGEPVLLLGGTKDDSLFQIPDLKEHLDLLASVGGNYIRNTMSDRPDKGFEVYAFKQLPNGKYDLNQWNEEYWNRFKNMLRWTNERDIIVQIEVWDRFDYMDSKEVTRWQIHPYNPKNNINYTYEESGFAESYFDHPSRDRHPFFHTIPGMDQYQKKYDCIRKYQEQFVEKLLSFSLQYGNVLYCMNNETSTSPQWGQYWIRFIRERAEQKDVDVYLTDMFDNGWKPHESETVQMEIDNPQIYTFIDISQVNSRNFNQDHWDRFQWVASRVKENAPRPLNHTKIYSDGQSSWGSGTPKDGIERFWRNILGGAASSRFHRPPTGIGLNELSQACIRSARMVETQIKFWDVEPRMDLLDNRESNEAYLTANPGEAYILFFTDGGSVQLDLRNCPGRFQVKWIDITHAKWGSESTLSGGEKQTIEAPGSGPRVAVIVK